MASRKITKTMAEEAAHRMRSKIYDEKIKQAQEVINHALEVITISLIPAGVLEACKNYGDYFSTARCININSINDNGYSTGYISGTLSFSIPSSQTCRKIDYKDFKKLAKLRETKDNIQEEARKFEEQIYTALITLKTDKKVEECLPEAMEFIVFPTPVSVPAPIFTELRTVLQNIKK